MEHEWNLLHSCLGWQYKSTMPVAACRTTRVAAIELQLRHVNLTWHPNRLLWKEVSEEFSSVEIIHHKSFFLKSHPCRACSAALSPVPCSRTWGQRHDNSLLYCRNTSTCWFLANNMKWVDSTKGNDAIWCLEILFSIKLPAPSDCITHSELTKDTCCCSEFNFQVSGLHTLIYNHRICQVSVIPLIHNKKYFCHTSGKWSVFV